MIQPLARFADDVYLDDMVLTRYGSTSALMDALDLGFFFDYAADVIYVNVDPEGHTVELAVASGLVSSSAENVTISSVTFEKSKGTGLYFLNGGGWSLDDVTTRLNHGSGMRLGEGSFVTASKAVWNGMMGLSSSASGIVIERSEIAWNNYARYQKAPAGGCWSAGAMKWVHAEVIFRFNFSHDNWCDGFWADHNVQAVVHDNVIVDNLRFGVFWELMDEADDSLHLFNNTIQNNGTGGFLASDAGNALVEDNLFGGNLNAFSASDTSRPGGPAGIVFRENALNGDGTPGCASAGVTCENNS